MLQLGKLEKFVDKNAQLIVVLTGKVALDELPVKCRRATFGKVGIVGALISFVGVNRNQLPAEPHEQFVT